MKIRFMDIQFHNHCNRQCWFCPPQAKNRPKEIKYMTEKTLLNVIDFIKKLYNENQIDGILSICTNRYNEPFTEFELYLKYIKILYSQLNHLPIAIACNSNGDLITAEKINLIIPYLHHMTISLYDLNLKEAISYINHIFSDKVFISNYKIDTINSEINFKYHNTLIYIKYNRFKTIKSTVRSRGSILNLNYKRTEYCSVINKMIAIDLNGDISPCCDLYSGNPEHYNIFPSININNSISIVELEKKLISFYKKTLTLKTCKSCSSTENNSMGSPIKI